MAINTTQANIDIALVRLALTGLAPNDAVLNYAKTYYGTNPTGPTNPNWLLTYCNENGAANTGTIEMWIINTLCGGTYTRDKLVEALYKNAFGDENSTNPSIPTLAAVKAALPASANADTAGAVVKAFVENATFKALLTPIAINALNAADPAGAQQAVFAKPFNLSLGAVDSVKEDTKGAVVGSLSASDSNSYDAGQLKFAIVGGADAASFEIVNGQLKLKSGIALDFESDADKKAEVTVRVTDSTNRFVDQKFVLNITDEQEAPGPQSQGIGLTTNTDVVFPDKLSATDDLVVGFRSISGVDSTVNAGDTIKDGSSTDNDTFLISSETLVGPKTGPYAAIDVFNVTTDKIENIVVDNDSGRRMDVDALNMKGVKYYESNGSGSLEGGDNGGGNAVRFINITEASGLSLKNTCADLIAQFKDSALAGDTTIKLKLENAGDQCDGVDICIEPDKKVTNYIETLAIESKGGPNYVSDILVGKGLTKITIEGSGDLTIGEGDASAKMAGMVFGEGHYYDESCAPGTHSMTYDNPDLKTIDGSKATGDLDLWVGKAITVTTGSGDDTIRLDSAGGKIDAGAGHDVVAFDGGFTDVPVTKAVALWDKSSVAGKDLGDWVKNVELIRFDGPVGGKGFQAADSILDVANLNGINCVEITELASFAAPLNIKIAPTVPALNFVQIPVDSEFKVVFDKAEPCCDYDVYEQPRRDVPYTPPVIKCPTDWIQKLVRPDPNGAWVLDTSDNPGWRPDDNHKQVCDGREPGYTKPICVADVNFDFGAFDYSKVGGKPVGPSNGDNTVNLVFEDKPGCDPAWQKEMNPTTLQPEDWQLNLSGREVAHMNVDVAATSADATIVLNVGNGEFGRFGAATYDNLDKLEDLVITGGKAGANGEIVFDGQHQALKSLTSIDASAVVDMDVHIKGLDHAANGMTIQTGSGNDYVEGTNHADQIFTNDGADIAKGLGGDDFMDLGAGNDRGFGGDGDDEIHAGDGIDCLQGEDGNDCLFGELDADLFTGGRGCDAFVIDITSSHPDKLDPLLDQNGDGSVTNEELVCNDCYIDVITDFEPGHLHLGSNGQLETSNRSGDFDKIVFTFDDPSSIFNENPNSPYEGCVLDAQFKNMGDLTATLLSRVVTRWEDEHRGLSDEHNPEHDWVHARLLELACNEVSKEMILDTTTQKNSIVVFGLEHDTYVLADTNNDGEADQAVKLLGVNANEINACDFAADCTTAFPH